jgi:fructose-specific phosphotransferase system component IIB
MVINSGLTETELQELIESARAIIIDLYISCEEDYVKGIKIYESIVEHNILQTTQSQIETLNERAKQLINSSQETFSKN